MLDDPALLAPPAWVVQPLFERGSLNSVYGPGKIGKSTMLASLAVHIAVGQDWAGYAVTRGGVLWIDLEQGPRRLIRNFRQVNGWDTADMAICSDLATVPPLSAIRAEVMQRQPALVVIDSLSKWGLSQPNPPENENDNDGWARILKPLEALARESPAAFVMIDHDRKGEGDHGRAMRGASSKLAAFDTAVHVKRGSGNARHLEGVSREIGDFKFTVERTENGYRSQSRTGEECRVLATLRAVGEPMSSKSLHHYLERQGYSVTVRTVRERLIEAVSAGRATVTLGEGTKNSPRLFSAVEATT